MTPTTRDGQDLPAAMKALRDRHLLTQAMLADAMGVSRREIIYIESGLNAHGRPSFSYRIWRKFEALEERYRAAERRKR